MFIVLPLQNLALNTQAHSIFQFKIALQSAQLNAVLPADAHIWHKYLHSKISVNDH